MSIEDFPTIRHLATRTGNHLAAECTAIVAELDRLQAIEDAAITWASAVRAQVSAQAAPIQFDTWVAAVEAELAAHHALLGLLGGGC